jgi:alkanesulfonate monooxygenase SsuD/methylene tetrahydromethanopterin reductase-like flavin-dependent oxidoreductase (luciferase family)
MRLVGGGLHRADGKLAVGRHPAAGRRLDQVTVVLGAVTVVDSDGATARRLARTEVAKYLAVVAELDATTELPPDSPTRSETWSRPAVTRPRGR